jgi:hypothetical protein
MLCKAFAAAGLTLVAVPGAVAAQPVQANASPSIDLSRDKPQAQCKSRPGELLVCGQRGPSPYRIDPIVLDAERSEGAAANPSRVSDRSGAAQLCGTVQNECGGGTIPLLEPALRVAGAAVMALKGDDWREAFRNGPSDYDRYRQTKQKRSGISVGVSASSGNKR